MTKDHQRDNNKSVGQKKKSFLGLGAGMIFLVVAFLGAINPAQADQQQNYKRFQEIQYGFSFEIPDQWTIKLTPKKDYLIEGPKGSDAFEIAIIIQIIQKSQNPPPRVFTVEKIFRVWIMKEVPSQGADHD